MEYSIYDLVYLQLAKINKYDDNTKKKYLSLIKILIENHYTDKEIIQSINDNTLDKLISRTSLGENLIIPNRIYFHKELRLSPKTVTVEFDYNTGELTKNEEPYFLEMKSSYTVENLKRYFINTLQPIANMDTNRINGAFKWLIKYYDLEILLFMIDCASEGDLKNVRNPLQIREYYEVALDKYEYVKKMSKINGDDAIVPKKRMQPNRNGMVV